MTLAERQESYQRAFSKWPASWPALIREQQRNVLCATWLIGNNYRNKSKLYGAYPNGYLARMAALFTDVDPDLVLHAFSGSLPAGDYERLDVVDRTGDPDGFTLGSVYDAPALFGGDQFQLVLADPPYSAADAAKYETGTVDRRRAIAALAQVTCVGGHLVWLDTVWPMHSKREWVTVGRITVVRSTNHRVRMATIFERVQGAETTHRCSTRYLSRQ
jgi:hypothetical protein